MRGGDRAWPVAHPRAGPTLVHVDVHDAGPGSRPSRPPLPGVGPGRRPAPGPGESQEVAWFTWEAGRCDMADDALAGALRVGP